MTQPKTDETPRTEADQRAALEGRIGIALGLWPGKVDVGGDRRGFVTYIADFIKREAAAAPPEPPRPDLRAAAINFLHQYDLWRPGSDPDDAFYLALAALSQAVAAPEVGADESALSLDVERLALYMHQARTSNDEPIYDMDEARRRAHIVANRMGFSPSSGESGSPTPGDER